MSKKTIKIVVPQNGKVVEAISFLPAGIINKTETGIGVTTLEADCKRHSIIVEPTRAIVISKSTAKNIKVANSCLAVIGETKTEKIIDYLRNDNEFKKIFVVSDSVNRLMKLIEDYTNINVFDDYFYLIDEVEQYQTEADYRPKMGQAIDYYWKFDSQMRALTTATMYYGFSNPLLNSEPMVEIGYKIPTKRTINLNATNNPILEAVDLIKKIDGKCGIFFNSIEGIHSIIKLAKLSEMECSIFCGQASKEKASPYYKDFTSVPNTKYNFYTSAYFSGIDLYNDYQIVTIIDVTLPHSILSPSELMQIRGRVRNNCLSDCIITNWSSSLIYDYSTYKTNLINKAKEFQEIIKNNLVYGNENYNLLREQIVKIEHNGLLLLRSNIDNNDVINYEEIDCKYIYNRSCNDLYSDQTKLYNYLIERNHNVSYSCKLYQHSQEQIDLLKTLKEETKEQRQETAKEIYNFIKSNEEKPKNINDFNVINYKQLVQETTGFKKQLFTFYVKYKNLEAIRDCDGDSKYLTAYVKSISFQNINSEHEFKKNIDTLFVGKELSPSEILTFYKGVSERFFPTAKPLTAKKTLDELRNFYEVNKKQIRKGSKRVWQYRFDPKK